MDKLENKLIDMREMYEECKDRASSPMVSPIVSCDSERVSLIKINHYPLINPSMLSIWRSFVDDHDDGDEFNGVASARTNH